MMGALWSGVTGLQAHQVAMDVEGNNIANVNTVGFKYSRASFADLFSQTHKVATAPQGDLGGKNSMQIGLGSTVNTVTKIFKQGTIQTTEKQSDMAIQGDGFFVVSPDGGKTYLYTRNGDFSLDSVGNFVDRNGYIVQGWLRNEDTGLIDPTGPLKNIVIEPGMSMEANPTSELAIIANLNSGSNIGTKSSPIYTLDEFNDFLDLNGNGLWDDGEAKNPNDLNTHTYYINSNKEVAVKEAGVDLGVVFNGAGEGINLREGQGMWVSYADAKVAFGALNNQQNNQQPQQHTLHISLNGIEIPAFTVTTMDEVAKKINEFTNKTGVQATVINGNELQLSNNNNSGTTDESKNIKIKKYEDDTTSIRSTNVITAYKYTYSSAAGANAGHLYSDSAARVVRTTEDLRKAMQTDAREYVNYSGSNVSNAVNGATYVTNRMLQIIDQELARPQPQTVVQIKNTINAQITRALQDGQATFNGLRDRGAVTAPISEGAVATIVEVLTLARTIMQNQNANTTVNDLKEAIRELVTNDKLATFASREWNSPLDADGNPDAVNNTINGLPNPTGNEHSNATYRDTNLNDGVKVTVNERGQFVFENPAGDASYGQNDGHWVRNNAAPPGAFEVKDSPNAFTDANGQKQVPSNQDTYINDYNMQIAVTGYSNLAQNINENSALANVFKSLSGGLSTGTSSRVSSNLTMSSHAATTEIYDSLGSKHEIKFEWRKISYSPENGTEWSLLIQVPEPGVLNADGAVSNVISGSARFNNDGTLLGFTPSTLTFTANNGSAPGQNIELNFGKIGGSNGLRSNDNPSTTDNIIQDGYAAGILEGTRIDESGTIIGSFSNGRGFGLAQVSLAVFTNNEGLETKGGSIFNQTANSGDPIFGAAGTGRRGTITASALEMSNVDLSRALTQLIVVQRGYQANSKTITTSDQMLTALLQIKQ